MFVRPEAARYAISPIQAQAAAASPRPLAHGATLAPAQDDVFMPSAMATRPAAHVLQVGMTPGQVQGLVRQPRLVRDILWGPLHNELQRLESQPVEFFLTPKSAEPLFAVLQRFPPHVARIACRAAPRFADHRREQWGPSLRVRLPHGLELGATLQPGKGARFSVDVSRIAKERDFRELVAFVENASHLLGTRIDIDDNQRTLFWVGEATDYRLAWCSALAAARW